MALDPFAGSIEMNRRAALLGLAQGVSMSAALAGLAANSREAVAVERKVPQREADVTAEAVLSVPSLLQINGGFCGRTCAAMVLQYNGWNVQPSDLTTIPEWCHINDLAAGMNAYTGGALEAYWWKSDSTNWFADLYYETNDIGQPMIVLIPNGSTIGHPFTRGHFVVVRGTSVQFQKVKKKGKNGKKGTKKKKFNVIHVADPADGGLWGVVGSYFKTAWATASSDAGPWQGLYFR